MFKIQCPSHSGAVVSRENAQVAHIHQTIASKVTFFPAFSRLAIVGRQDAQITNIDFVIAIGIAGDFFLQSEVVINPNKGSARVIFKKVALATIEDDVHVILRSADPNQSVVLAGRTDRKRLNLAG